MQVIQTHKFDIGYCIKMESKFASLYYIIMLLHFPIGEISLVLSSTQLKFKEAIFL